MDSWRGISYSCIVYTMTTTHIFVDGGSWVVLQIDPISKELDKDTISILDHLRWTQTKGLNSAETVTKQEDVLIDLTVPATTDTQTCGLRALQYHVIIGETFAQSPRVLKERGEALQQFIVDVVTGEPGYNATIL